MLNIKGYNDGADIIYQNIASDLEDRNVITNEM